MHYFELMLCSFYYPAYNFMKRSSGNVYTESILFNQPSVFIMLANLAPMPVIICYTVKLFNASICQSPNFFKLSPRFHPTGYFIFIVTVLYSSYFNRIRHFLFF